MRNIGPKSAAWLRQVGLRTPEDLADRSPGFVWRLQGDSGNATDIQVADDPNFIVNMSVWKDLDSLFAYVYRSDHLQVMAQRRQWFEKPSGAFMALWWRSEEHTSELQSLMRISYAVFCLKKKNKKLDNPTY